MDGCRKVGTKKGKQIGRCRYCSEMILKEKAAAHVKSCKEREECRKRVYEYSGEERPCFDIFITAKRRPDYWGMIEIDETCTLEELHSYIDRMWYILVEESIISGVRYMLEPFIDMEEEPWESTDIQLKEILSPGLRFKQICFDGDSRRTLELKVAARNECCSAVEEAVYPFVHGDEDWCYAETVIPKVLSREELCWEIVEGENETEYLLNGVSLIRSSEDRLAISAGFLKDEIDIPQEQIADTVERLKKDIEEDFMIHGREFSEGFVKHLCRKYGFKQYRINEDDLPF